MAIDSVLPWFFSALFFLRLADRGVRFLKRWIEARTWYSDHRQIRALEFLENLLQEFDETLQVGLVPSPERWQLLITSHPFLGPLIFRSLQEMRAEGSSIQSTLRRFFILVREQRQIRQKARARVSLALSQAGVCLAMIPVLSSFLYLLLPGVESAKPAWISATLVALVLGGAGSAWILRMAWATARLGFRPENEPWLVLAPVGGERFLAKVRTGVPPDLAWTQMHQELVAQSPALSQALGPQIWADSSSGKDGELLAEKCVFQFGVGVRNAIQRSLMEGLPCLDRVIAHLDQLSVEFRTLQEKEISLLPMRVLKPVFFCLAPALFGLFVVAMALAWREMSQGGF